MNMTEGVKILLLIVFFNFVKPFKKVTRKSKVKS